MEPEKHEIVELDATAVLGVTGLITCGGDVGDLWEPTLTRRMKEITKLATVRNRYYGVSYFEGGDHRYLAGMVVDPPSTIPAGLVLREIPAGTYVRFEGAVEWFMNDGPDWVHSTWLPASPYERDRDASIHDFLIHGVRDWVTFCVPVIPPER